MVDLGVAGARASRTAQIGMALALAGAFAYGVNIVAARFATQSGITGPDIVVYRALVFLPVAVIFCILTGRPLALSRAERPGVLRFALFGAGTAIGYISSLKYLPVPIAVTVFYTYPLLVILISPYVDGTRLTARRWVVAILAFIGILLAVGPHAEALDPRGIALAFVGALCCAGMFITGAGLRTDGIVTFVWSQVVVLPLALAMAWWGGGLATLGAISAAGWPFLVTATGFFLGLVLQLLAAPRLSAATAGLLFLAEPVVAIAVASLVLGEHVSVLQAFGMLLVLGSLVYDVWPMLRSPRTTPA